jgi:hypothetical protein
MRLADINATTQGIFFRCLTPNEPESPDESEIGMQWHENHRVKGHRVNRR